jgi:hypothetical protein
MPHTPATQKEVVMGLLSVVWALRVSAVRRMLMRRMMGFMGRVKE